MAYALSEETVRAIQRRREEIDQVFREYAEAHPGPEDPQAWTDDGWQDDPA